MSIATKNIPKTSVLLDTQPNPTERIIQTDVFGNNNTIEEFSLRTNLVHPQLVTSESDSEQLNIDNSVVVDVNNFVIIFKSISVTEGTGPQNYAFPSYLELLNYRKVLDQIDTDFSELEVSINPVLVSDNDVEIIEAIDDGEL
jgi:hypothetical protein